MCPTTHPDPGPHAVPASREAVAIDVPPAPEAPLPSDDAGEGPLTDEALAIAVEALLVGTDRPLTEARLAELAGIAGPGASKRVRSAIASLNDVYTEAGRAFTIERLAGGWQILTRAEHGPLLARLHRDRQQSRLSPAAMETLSIVAYRQPIIRAEIEAIRGVACGEVLRGLLERRLLKIAGRAEELGRPMLYGTTKEFLKVFGLANLDDLPPVEGLGPEKTRRPRAAAVPPDPDDVIDASTAGATAEDGDTAAETGTDG